MRFLCFIAMACSLCACSMLGTQPRDVAGSDPERLIIIAVANPITAIARRAGGTPRGYGANRYRVSPSAQRDLRAVASIHQLTPLDAWPIEIIGVHCAVMQIAPGKSRAAVLAQLSIDPRVALAQPLQMFATRTETTANLAAPSSENEATERYYNDPYAELQVSLDGMNLRNAHALATGKGVRIAVIDTGVDIRHPDLAGRVLSREDLVRGDFRGFTQDLHGTAIAGIIAAVANNGVGIVGVAPDARILALKACWYQGDTSASKTGAAHCNSFTLARAISAAIDRSAQVINMSLAGPADALLERLLKVAMDRGILVIAAASDDSELSSFPASMPGVIGVQMAGGPMATVNSEYLRAPGQEILTLRPAAHYDFESGNSIAAANVTGVVALLLQHRAALTSSDVRALLEIRTTELTTLDSPPIHSIDACAAVASLVATGRCSQAPVRTATARLQKKPLSPTK